MAQFDKFDPVGAFQGARQNRNILAQQGQAIEAERSAAPIRNELSQLKLGQAKVGAERSQTQFDQQQAIQKATIINQSARALKQIDPSQWPAAFAKLEPRLEQFGIPRGTFDAQKITPEALDSVIAETQGFLQDPNKLLSASQRERAQLLKDIQPALDDQGRIDPNKLDANSRSAAAALGIVARAGTVTGRERAATDKDLGEKIISFETKLKSSVRQAETEAKARGETVTAVTKAKAAMPSIAEVVGKLKLLSDDATFTLAGKGFNRIAKELGFSTSAGTSRASMISIVDNQVLPLLRPIFGAAFTKAEGDSLKQALVDPNSTPDSRKAQLDSFLDQMVRNIEVQERELQAGQQTESGDVSTLSDEELFK